MRSIVYALFSILLLGCDFEGRESDSREVLFKAKTVKYESLDFEASNLTGPEALKTYTGLSDSDYEIYRDVTTSNGSRSQRYRQLIRGLRLYRSESLLITDKNGMFVRLSSRSIDPNDLEIKTTKFSESKAVISAIQGVFGRAYNESSFVVPPTTEKVFYRSDKQKIRGGYVVYLNGSPQGKTVPAIINGVLLYVLVDGNTGQVVDIENRVSD